jgi:hypothetical protein
MISFALKGLTNIFAILWFLCNVATIFLLLILLYVWAFDGSWIQICKALLW